MNFYNEKFIMLQTCCLGLLQGMSYVFFATELYTTIVLVYVRAPPAAAVMGLFTAFLTIISIRAVFVSYPDTFLKTVVFQTVWSSILLALWLPTATSHDALRAALAPHVYGSLPTGLTSRTLHLYIVYDYITLHQREAYLSALALMVYIAALSVVTVQALNVGQPGVWRASTWELPYPQGTATGKSNGSEAAGAQ